MAPGSWGGTCHTCHHGTGHGAGDAGPGITQGREGTPFSWELDAGLPKDFLKSLKRRRHGEDLKVMAAHEVTYPSTEK